MTLSACGRIPTGPVHLCSVHLTPLLYNLYLQVDASKVAIGPSWQPVLQQLVAQVAVGLGLGQQAGGVAAQLYKLLLYERGGHFAAHRDTEKAPGMFATLVVQLPCCGGHEGGGLLVRHGGRQVQVDTAQVGGGAGSRPAGCTDAA